MRADRKPCEVLCLGVGALETSSAQYQLALLLELRDRLAQCTIEAHADDEGLCTTIFDPLFGPLDVAVASQLDMRLPAENLVRMSDVDVLLTCSAGDTRCPGLRLCICHIVRVNCTRRCCVRTGRRMRLPAWCYAATTSLDMR